MLDACREFVLHKDDAFIRISWGYIGLCLRGAKNGVMITYLQGLKVPFLLSLSSRDSEFALMV